MFKFFNKKSSTTTSNETIEPKFLNEYRVSVGMRDSMYVHASSEAEAVRKIRNAIAKDTEFIDSRYYTAPGSNTKDSFICHPRGDIYAVLLKKNAVKNPNYRA